LELSFKIPDYLIFKNILSPDSLFVPERNIYIIDNKRTQQNMLISNLQLPLYMQYESKFKHLIYSNQNSLSIYKLDSLLIESNMLPFYETTNFFELDTIANWDSNFQLLDSNVVYSKPFSENVLDTSSCFIFPLQNTPKFNFLFIKGKLEVIQFDNSISFIELFVKDSLGQVVLNESINIDERIRAYGQGATIRFRKIVDLQSLISKSYIEIYLRNSDNNDLYIDDFNIQLYGLQ
jgi:hypothetical protein